MKKRALLIGNSNYIDQPKLPGVTNDIELMRQTLGTISFQTIDEYHDVTTTQIDEVIRNFFIYDNPEPNDINLIYYSGHGVTVDSDLCMVTVKQHEFSRSYGLYKIATIIGHFGIKTSSLILVLDMCRSYGIDSLPSPSGNNITVIYATGANDVSSIDYNGLSCFTQCFANSLTLVNANISSVVASTKAEMEAKKYSQKPGIYQSVQNDIILNPLALDMTWFRNQAYSAIRHLGKRYCHEVNVSVGLENTFDALCFTEDFINNLVQQLDQQLTDYDKALQTIIQRKKAEKEAIQELVERKQELSSLLQKFISHLSIEDIQELSSTADIIKTECHATIDYCEAIERKESNDSAYENIREIIYSILEIKDIVESQLVKLAIKPCAYLHGDGGIGKTHSIAHLVHSRAEIDKPSILLIGGGFFSSNNPDEQIMHELQLNCEFGTLLSYLNNYGQEHNTRVLICLDALNEGQGKDIWKYKLNSLIDRISRFPWIALLVSSRTFFYEDLRTNDDIVNDSIIPISHPGFTRVGFDSIIKYFEYYKLDWNPSLLMLREFSKPLFLRLFCEGHANEKVSENEITAGTVYSKYINAVNKRIAEMCGFNEHIPAVHEFLKQIQIIKFRHIVENGRDNRAIQQVEESEYIGTACEIMRKYGITEDFLSALFHEDILTNVRTFKGKSFAITYERIEDYYLSGMLFDVYKETGGLGEEIISYLQYNTELLREFICCVANRTQSEIDTVISIDDSNKTYIVKAFVEALLWRNTSSITRKTGEFINSWVLGNSNVEYDFWNTIVSLAPYTNHPYNGDSTYNFMLDMKMADRDASFIPIWDILLERENSLAIMLINWMKNKSIQERTGVEETICACKCICWFLISPNHYVRDLATEALQFAMLYHLSMIPEFLENIKLIDDPYVMERVLAAVYGCIMCTNKQLDDIKKIGDWIYHNICCNEPVTTNVMIRDYASGIIEFVQKHRDDCVEYTTHMLSNCVSGSLQIPDDKEIEQYKEQLGPRIVHSMKVEYDREGRPGGYGDFGRYTFQSYFSKWTNGLNYNDLMNVALKNIIDRGYDFQKHNTYDQFCRYDRSGPNERERIGKKYQWLALYELAGTIIDHYPIAKYVEESDREEVLHGLRNYDPSLSFFTEDTNENHIIHNSLYSIDNDSQPSVWLSSYDDFNIQNIKRFFELCIRESNYYLVKGHYNWKPNHVFGLDMSMRESRGMYLIINMYFVRKIELEKTIDLLGKQDFMGRWMPEKEYGNNYFIRERYWSDLYRKNEENLWQKPERNPTEVSVMIPCVKYSTEGKDDRPKAKEIRYYFPCSELVNEFNMLETDDNSVMIASDGSVLSFDSSEYLRESIGLFVKNGIIKQYASNHGLVPIWTILGEKWSTGLPYSEYEGALPGHVSGLYYLSEDGEVRGECKVINRE